MGTVPIPYANKVTKVLGQFVGRLIAIGFSPKIILQLLVKIVGNLTTCCKAYQGIKALLELFCSSK
jgi:hypothetical protein